MQANRPASRFQLFVVIGSRRELVKARIVVSHQVKLSYIITCQRLLVRLELVEYDGLLVPIAEIYI